VTGFFGLLDWIGFGWVIDSSFWFLKILWGLWVSGLFVFDCGRTLIFHYCKRVAWIKKILTRLINLSNLDRIAKLLIFQSKLIFAIRWVKTIFLENYFNTLFE
jgi:hypothetical protein